MATEKILIFDEAGNAKRMKVRIARFLDNEPVTASDKTNIRTTLDVDDSLSGTFTTPLSVTSASDSSFTGGGKVGIGTSSPGSYSSSAYDLVVGTNSGNHGATIVAGSTSTGSLFFADGTGATERQQGAVSYNHTANSLAFKTDNTTRWTINSTGNLVGSSGVGIDFGSGAIFDAYEHGDITSVTDVSGAGLAITADLKYQVIGKSVQISGKIIFPVTADSRTARVSLLPEQCPNDDGARGLSVSYSTTGSGLYVLPLGNTNHVMFYNLSGSSQTNSDLSGHVIFISGNYSIN